MATLFLNFYFCNFHAANVWMVRPLPLYAGMVAVASLLFAALLFLAPALACAKAGRDLSGTVADSLGSIPAGAVRLCSVVLLVCWLVELIGLATYWQMQIILQQSASLTKSVVAATLLMVFLVFTGLQNRSTEARLALFTNKLALAMLVAGFLRVHEGWTTALHGAPFSLESSDLLHAVSGIGIYVGPLAFLGADFGYHLRGRKQVILAAGTGVALPLFAAVVAAGVVNAATFGSEFYQPSLNPSLAMALFGKASQKALPGPMMLATITIFGAARFGVKALAASGSIAAITGWRRWLAGGCIGAIIVWLTARPFTALIAWPREITGACLAVTAAVVTADLLAGRGDARSVRRVDSVGLTALLVGMSAFVYIRLWGNGAEMESWWGPWLLPSYAAAFVTCLLGRYFQKRQAGLRS